MFVTLIRLFHKRKHRFATCANVFFTTYMFCSHALTCICTCVNVGFLMYKVCCLTQTKVCIRTHRFRTRVNVCFSMYVLCGQAQTLLCLRKHRFRIGVYVCFNIVYLPQMNAYMCLTFISTGCDKDIVVFRKFLHFAKLLLRTAVLTF